MKKETETKLHELLDYLTTTLKYYSRNDDFWKTALSLTRHTAKELIPIVEKELEGEEE